MVSQNKGDFLVTISPSNNILQIVMCCMVLTGACSIKVVVIGKGHGTRVQILDEVKNFYLFIFFLFIYLFIYLSQTFCPHLGSFCVVSSFTTFRPNFTSGLLQVIYRDLGSEC